MLNAQAGQCGRAGTNRSPHSVPGAAGKLKKIENDEFVLCTSGMYYLRGFQRREK
jgi:hypothetical protein